MLNLNGKRILITGGTGSFGKSFAHYIFENFKPKTVVILSRDELKQFQMQKEFAKYKNIRFFLGDIRDEERLERAFEDVDIIIHAAALKQVPALEYNPFEAVKTNIIGTQNVIRAALNKKVKKVLFISTDKAAHPINLYGATKLAAEKLIIASNSYSGKNSTVFSVVRYGNVLGSRGSIVETILNGKKDDPIMVTDKNMTRFWITLPQCFDLVMFALGNMIGGEIFVPKVPSMGLMDLFDAIAPERKKIDIGIRPGEKIHEILVTESEAVRAFDVGGYFVITPIFFNDSHTKRHTTKYSKMGKKNEKVSSYTSDTNHKWLKGKDILKLIK